MRTSATGTSAQRAFTLIELLVVVAIIGVLVAVAAINLFPDERQLSRREATDVAIAIEHARDTAWFGGLPTSVTFDDGEVREWRLAGDRWRGEQSRLVRLPESIRVAAVTVDGQPLAPKERLVFFSDGLGTPFRVALEVRGTTWAVEGDAAGAVRLLEP